MEVLMVSRRENFVPVVPEHTKRRELTLRSFFLGILLGLLFAVGNTYLALRVGTTVSASIPAAVMSMAIMRLCFKNVSILENNIVQTIASVGEGLAGGVIFTVPALFFLGAPPTITHIFILASLGGILGVLFMIPMRRYIIVQEHGKLPFPEGTACAEILKTGASSRPNAVLGLCGIVVGALHKLFSTGLHVWQETVTWTVRSFQNTVFSIDCTPALLGVGYIIGPRVAALMLAGGVLGWWIIIPMIHLFGQGLSTPIYPSTVPISQMTSGDLWANYIRYIGAGTVAIGGILGLLRIFPVVGKTLKAGFKEMFKRHQEPQHISRTDRDIPVSWLLFGAVGIILFLWLWPGFHMNFVTIVLLVILSFFFVGVTSMTVGIVGSTSNPGSGMTLTVLLVTCLVFVLLGWTERVYLIAAMTMGCVACVAICLAATTSQDLKTGYLLGATPRAQQIAEILGIFLPALVIGGTLYLLNKAYGFGSEDLPAPQATLMALIVKGVINGELPLILVSVGVIIGLMLILLKTPILPFALGLYLPLSLTTGIMMGGLVSLVLQRKKASPEVMGRGILAASGLVAGDACMGVLIALLTILHVLSPTARSFFSERVSLLLYVLLAVALGVFSWRSPKK